MQQQGTNTAGSDQLAALLGLKPGTNIQDVLKNLPGFQFALDQGSQNVMRNQAATGQLNSGKTNIDLQNQGIGQASQNYFNYAGQLQPFLGAANTGANNIAGVNQNLGNQTNASLMNQGNAAYGTQAGIGNANAQMYNTELGQSAGIFGGLTGLASSALKLSTAKAKDDIEPVGELFDGQPVFRYRYKGSPRHEIGLIAERVEEREPGAVREFPGTRVKGVDYRRATDYAATLGRMLKAA
jgi:hypothetical protein